MSDHAHRPLPVCLPHLAPHDLPRLELCDCVCQLRLALRHHQFLAAALTVNLGGEGGRVVVVRAGVSFRG